MQIKINKYDMAKVGRYNGKFQIVIGKEKGAESGLMAAQAKIQASPKGSQQPNRIKIITNDRKWYASILIYQENNEPLL